MKTFCRYTPICALLMLFLVSCGYHNPNIYTGPDRVIYLPNWKNRTSDLGLDARLYQSLVKWYQKSGSISITKKKDEAHLILAGEIISIDLPSLSYGSSNTATEVKVHLRVRYVMKDLTNDTILFEQPGEVWSESYLVGGSTSETRDNQQDALETIIDDISERIYQKSLIKMQAQ